MVITSKSLFHSNIAFIFDREKFISPPSEALTGFYRGAQATGMRFFDDPLIKTKVLTLPALKLRVTLEAERLRVDDESQEEPPKSILPHEALAIYRNIATDLHPSGYGFNFDIYYRFNNVIPIKKMFSDFLGDALLRRDDLLDFGVQFTMDREKGKFREIWFMKITSPLELAVHLNRHFTGAKIPAEDSLRKDFERCYTEADEVVLALISRF